MPLNTLIVFRRQRLARAGVGILILAGAAFAQYRLAHVSSAVDVATIKELSPAIISGREEFVVEGPVVNAAEGILFSHDGLANETVDVTFDRARLDAPTIAKFESYGFGLKPPATAAQIKYQSQESPAPSDEPCRTRVELRTTLPIPSEIRFSQFDASGPNRGRYLAMRISGAELTADMLTDSPNGSGNGPGCQKLLKVGDWNQALVRNAVATVVSADSAFSFYFRPLTADASVWAETQGFLPLDLGTGQGNSTDPAFQARALSINSLGSSGSASARVSARGADDTPLLTISALRIGPDQIQVSIAGKAHVEINGRPVTVNFLKPIQDNPVLLAILVATNGALLAWVVRLIFKTPESSRSSKDD